MLFRSAQRQSKKAKHEEMLENCCAKSRGNRKDAFHWRKKRQEKRRLCSGNFFVANILQLLSRRLSGKRTTTDIVPGSSSQKQSFMPRSASSQDGVALSLSPAPMSQLLLNDNSHLTVQTATTQVIFPLITSINHFLD
jgi:hypothetical protein